MQWCVRVTGAAWAGRDVCLCGRTKMMRSASWTIGCRWDIWSLFFLFFQPDEFTSMGTTSYPSPPFYEHCQTCTVQGEIIVGGQAGSCRVTLKRLHGKDGYS